MHPMNGSSQNIHHPEYPTTMGGTKIQNGGSFASVMLRLACADFAAVEADTDTELDTQPEL